MCVTANFLAGINDCPIANAGVKALYLVECKDFGTATVGTAGALKNIVTAITTAGSPTPAQWKKFQADIDTLSLTQEQTSERPNQRAVVQTITGTVAGYGDAFYQWFRDLDECCCYVVVAELNTGKFILLGVNHVSGVGTINPSDARQMRLTAATHSTGAAIADPHNVSITLTATTNAMALPLSTSAAAQVTTNVAP